MIHYNCNNDSDNDNDNDFMIVNMVVYMPKGSKNFVNCKTWICSNSRCFTQYFAELCRILKIVCFLASMQPVRSPT